MSKDVFGLNYKEIKVTYHRMGILRIFMVVILFFIFFLLGTHIKLLAGKVLYKTQNICHALRPWIAIFEVVTVYTALEILY